MKLIPIISIAAVLAVAGCQSSTSSGASSKATDAPKTTTASAPATTKAPKKTQAEEVTLTKCDAPDAIGVVYVEGTVTNGSSKPSDYIIDVEVDDPTGTKIGSGTAIPEHVAHAQKALWKAITDTDGSNWKTGSVCKVVKVERNASV